MPADSDSKPASLSGASRPNPNEAAEERAVVAPPRPLLSELGARLAQAIRGLGTNSKVRESLEEVIEESAREAQDISPQERLMLGNLLKFGELRVADVMVPRADIVAVEEQTPLPDLVALFREAQHSRLPLYRETLDDPIGMVHIKDVMGLVDKGADGHLHWPQAPIVKFRREVLFVPGVMPAIDLLMKMQATRIHLALVIDEYGGTDGLVSIEDLVEVIVGEIDDEHDVEEAPQIVAHADGGFDADARTNLEDFKDHSGLDLAALQTDEEIDTLGGVVSALLGRVPVRGEIVVQHGIEFEVLDADARRVRRLRIHVLPPAAGAAMSRLALRDRPPRLHRAIGAGFAPRPRFSPPRAGGGAWRAGGAQFRAGRSLSLDAVGLCGAGAAVRRRRCGTAQNPRRRADRLGFRFRLSRRDVLDRLCLSGRCRCAYWQLPFVAVLFPGGLALFFGLAGALCMLHWLKGAQRIFLFHRCLHGRRVAARSYIDGLSLESAGPWLGRLTGDFAKRRGVRRLRPVAADLSVRRLPGGAGTGRRKTRAPAGCRRLLTLFFVLLWADGEARLFYATDAVVPGVRLRLVQPGISETEKYVQRYREGNWQRLIDLSERPADVAPTHIIWPEAAAIPPWPADGPLQPFESIFLFNSPEAIGQIARLTGDGRVLLTGYVRDRCRWSAVQFLRHVSAPTPNCWRATTNFISRRSANICPSSAVLRAIGLTEIAADTGFSSGPGPRTFSVPGAPPVEPLICYDIIFPLAVTGAARPQWLVNITDDSWFGPNTGPMQHLADRPRAGHRGRPAHRARRQQRHLRHHRSLRPHPAKALVLVFAVRWTAIFPPLWRNLPIRATAIGLCCCCCRCARVRRFGRQSGRQA